MDEFSPHEQSVESFKKGQEQYTLIQNFAIDTLRVSAAPLAYEELVDRIASLGYERSLTDQAIGDLIANVIILLNDNVLSLR